MNTGRPHNWVPYAGLMLAVAGIIYQGGVLSNSVQRNTERIVVLESNDASRDAAVGTIDRRTAAIEAKLDLLLEDRKR